MTDAPLFLTSGQAAKLLGLTKLTVTRWAKKGAFPGAWVTPTNHWRIPPAAVNAVLERTVRWDDAGQEETS